MGYTHYWTQTRDLTEVEWVGVARVVHGIIAASDVTVVNGDGEPGTKPEIKADYIALNGEAPNHYETFEITRRVDGDGWSFCKTQHRPYDLVVTAILAYLGHIGSHAVTSDGDDADWTNGVDLARRASGLDVTVPKEVAR